MGLGSQGRDTKSKVNVAKGNAYECSSWSLAGGKGAHYQIKLASSFYAQSFIKKKKNLSMPNIVILLFFMKREKRRRKMNIFNS